MESRQGAADWPCDDDLLRTFGERFRAQRVESREWTHAAHLAVAIYFLAMCPDLVAEHAMAEAIRAHNLRTGTPNNDSDGYHATITLASLGATRALLHAHPADASPAAVARALIASRFGSSAWILSHWSRERLFTPQARRAWTEPDLAPLAFPVLHPGIVVTDAHAPGAVGVAATLFEEYRAAIGIDLGFQDFAAEHAALPGDYVPAAGALLVAFADADAAGCCAIRPLDQGACELKRMWVRPRFRGRGIGQLLLAEAIDRARRAGHDRMLLDTLPGMETALGLYLRSGFAPIARYNDNPLPGALWLARPIARP